jgi:hypothetical protein
VQGWNYDDSLLAGLRIPYHEFSKPLLSLGLQRVAYLQRVPHRVGHGWKSALLLDALQTLKAPFVERKDDSLRFCHGFYLLSSFDDITLGTHQA